MPFLLYRMKFNILKISAAILLISIISYGQNSIRSIELISRDVCVAVSGSNTIYRSTDGGTTWDEIKSGTSENLNKLIAIKKNVLLATCDNGIIIRSTDDGGSWLPVNTGATDNIKGISVTQLGIGFAVGDSNLILYTNNYGSNWQRVSINRSNFLNDVSMFDKDNGIIVGNNNLILFTSNGGLSWNLPSTSPYYSSNLMHVKMTGKQTAFILSDDGKILRTTDGGINWSLIFTNYHEAVLNKLLQFDTATIAAVGAKGKIILSRDNGNSWNTVNTGTISDLYCVSFAGLNLGFAGGDDRTLLITHDGGITWSPASFSPQEKTLKAENKLVNSIGNFPNPFNPTTRIHYELKFDANVSIKVFDISGKEIATLGNSFEKAGNHFTDFNGSNLASGVYFYRFTITNGINKFEKTTKMLMIK